MIVDFGLVCDLNKSWPLMLYGPEAPGKGVKF